MSVRVGTGALFPSDRRVPPAPIRTLERSSRLGGQTRFLRHDCVPYQKTHKAVFYRIIFSNSPVRIGQLIHLPIVSVKKGKFCKTIFIPWANLASSRYFLTAHRRYGLLFILALITSSIDHWSALLAWSSLASSVGKLSCITLITMS